MKRKTNQQSAERGSASAKFLIILTVIILAANAGYNYIPVAYQGESVKQEMGTAVVQSLALPSNVNVVDSLKTKLQRILLAEGIPPANALVEVKQVNNTCQARVAYSQAVKILPFGLYNYTYKFDHTATPTGFLAKSIE
jgi:hypothetical protein